jgi:hypothetical protein
MDGADYDPFRPSEADHSRYSPTSDAQRRAALGQSRGLYDAASQQANFATLPRFGNTPIPYHLSQNVVSGIGDNRLYEAPFHRE